MVPEEDLWYTLLRWYHLVSNCEVRRLSEQPPLTTIIQKRRLTLFGHLVRMDESADARRILIAVSQSEWRRPVGWPYTSWMATLKNDLARHNLTLEDAIELALNKPLWRLLAASGAMHWWCMPNNDDDDVWSYYGKKTQTRNLRNLRTSGRPVPGYTWYRHYYHGQISHEYHGNAMVLHDMP